MAHIPPMTLESWNLCVMIGGKSPNLVGEVNDLVDNGLLGETMVHGLAGIVILIHVFEFQLGEIDVA